jgi:hypothetical protein
MLWVGLELELFLLKPEQATSSFLETVGLIADRPAYTVEPH